MMVKVSLLLSDFSCSLCKTPGKTDRHHVKNEKLFVRAFEHNAIRSKGGRYKKFVARYNQFNPKDIELLCRSCHEYMHDLYHEERYTHEFNNNKYIEDFTWKEADTLMKAFAQIYKETIKEGV